MFEIDISRCIFALLFSVTLY